MIWDSLKESEPPQLQDCKGRTLWIVWVEDDIDWNDLSFTEESKVNKLVKIDNCPLVYEDDVEVVVNLHGSHRTLRKNLGEVWQTRMTALMAAARKVTELRNEGHRAKFKST